MKMRVIVIDKLDDLLLAALTEAGIEVLDLRDATDEAFMSAWPSADGVAMRSRYTMDAELLSQAPQLKFIARAGAGIDHIDQEYCAAHGITILTSPEGNRQSVAEHALGMLLGMLNKLNIADLQVRKGQWDRVAMAGEELAGKKVGIIGYGNTGSAFAQVLAGFGVELLVYDKYKAEVPHAATMDRLHREADVVSLHVPLTEETRGLVNRSWLSRFERPIWLVNTSRGKVVNTRDLLDAMDRGRVVGAALDVLEFENDQLKIPSVDELPEVAKRLFSNERVLLSPHVAGQTRQSHQKLSTILAEKIIRLVSNA